MGMRQVLFCDHCFAEDGGMTLNKRVIKVQLVAVVVGEDTDRGGLSPRYLLDLCETCHGRLTLQQHISASRRLGKATEGTYQKGSDAPDNPIG